MKAQQDYIDSVCRTEERHIDHIPEGEQEEVRQIYAAKGFEGQLLEDIVQGITRDRDLWLATMLMEEYGLQSAPANPWRAGVQTLLTGGTAAALAYGAGAVLQNLFGVSAL